MHTPPHILVCDAPAFPLEDCLPLLRQLGYTCTYVESVDALPPGQIHPDLLMISTEMPGGASGESFLSIRNHYKNLPIIAVAHVRSLSTAIAFFRAGVSDYLPAPLDPEETRHRIEAALAPSASSEESSDVDAVEVQLIPSPPLADVCQTAEGEAALQSNASQGFRTLPCGAVLLDGAGNLIEANPAALTMLGCASDEELAQRLSDRQHAFDPRDGQDHEIASNAWPDVQACKEKAYRSSTMSLRRPDQTRIWVRCDAEPSLERGRVRYVALALTNVTDEYAKIRRLRDAIHSENE